uniref:Secreted protein n=1 Tax=Paramormyrops kingsleyae TaxID=1676925 RepID=A0A3B3RXS0_9TELE
SRTTCLFCRLILFFFLVSGAENSQRAVVRDVGPPSESWSRGRRKDGEACQFRGCWRKSDLRKGEKKKSGERVGSCCTDLCISARVSSDC